MAAILLADNTLILLTIYVAFENSTNPEFLEWSFTLRLVDWILEA